MQYSDSFGYPSFLAIVHNDNEDVSVSYPTKNVVVAAVGSFCPVG